MTGVATFTVTMQVAEAPFPSAAVAVIWALSAFSAFTVPSEITVATMVSEDAQFNSLLVASSGVTEAVSFLNSPTVSVSAGAS